MSEVARCSTTTRLLKTLKTALMYDADPSNLRPPPLRYVMQVEGITVATDVASEDQHRPEFRRELYIFSAAYCSTEIHVVSYLAISVTLYMRLVQKEAIQGTHIDFSKACSALEKCISLLLSHFPFLHPGINLSLLLT